MKKGIFVCLVLLTIIIVTGCGSNKSYSNCKNCKYSRYKVFRRYNEKRDKLNDYKEDYKELESKIFLGHELDSDGKILKGYACGIEKGSLVCVQGDTDGSSYDDNVDILYKVFGNKCSEETYTTSTKYFNCEGEDITINVNSSGKVYVSTSKSDQCYVSGGAMYCIGN